jgi:hypothetical protein
MPVWESIQEITDFIYGFQYLLFEFLLFKTIINVYMLQECCCFLFLVQFNIKVKFYFHSKHCIWIWMNWDWFSVSIWNEGSIFMSYVIKFVSYLLQVSGFLHVLCKTNCHEITHMVLNMMLKLHQTNKEYSVSVENYTWYVICDELYTCVTLYNFMYMNV